MNNNLLKIVVGARWPDAAWQWLAVVLAIVLGPIVRADDDAGTWNLVEEHWYTVQIGSHSSGWMHMATYSDGVRFRTSTNMSMNVSRMGDAGTIAGSSTFTETAEGRPVEMTSQQTLSAQAMFNKWVFGEENVQHIAQQGERESARELALPEGKWLTPRGVRKYFTERLKSGAEEITFRTISPEQGLVPIMVRSKREGEGAFITSGEREIPVTIWKTVTTVMPIESVEHYTADGVLVYQETPTGLGTITMRRVSKAEALNIEAVDGPVAMLPQTFITPSRPMEKARQARRATMLLRVKSGSMPEIPTAGAQRATRENGDAAHVRLAIDIDDNVPATEQELSDPAFRNASPMIDSDDAIIRALARRALAAAKLTSADDAMARAEAMRSFVHSYITNPTLDVPFASASETARTRAGDCSEFGVLLAAMLRAEGIPSRVASGLVYADQFAGMDNIFGWHMWTQALIDGRWVDLDATLPVRYHAGHVLIGTSSLADGQGTAEMAAMMMLIGNLEIDIIDVEH